MMKMTRRMLMAAVATVPLMAGSAWAEGLITVIVNDPANPYWFTEGEVAKDGRSRQGREQVPGLDRAAVDGQPRDPRVTPTGGAQPQLRQRHVVLVHSPTRH